MACYHWIINNDTENNAQSSCERRGTFTECDGKDLLHTQWLLMHSESMYLNDTFPKIGDEQEYMTIQTCVHTTCHVINKNTWQYKHDHTNAHTTCECRGTSTESICVSICMCIYLWVQRDIHSISLWKHLLHKILELPTVIRWPQTVENARLLVVFFFRVIYVHVYPHQYTDVYTYVYKFSRCRPW